MSRPRFLPDNFTLALIATVLLATFLPCSGQTAVVFEWVTNIGIGLLSSSTAPSCRARRSSPA
ncbi:allantoate amidohydrolase domain protein [Pseudomonas aeruginosa]|nr:allantoate amidohydrolase domain protein [Pseudomonas aeruginosa]